MEKFHLGSIKSKPRLSDVRVKTIIKARRETDGVVGLPSVPKTLDLRPQMFGVRDQGSLGSCVAESCANAKDWEEKRDKTDPITTPTSPLYVFNLRGNKTVDGMSPRGALEILQDKGIALENQFPYEQNNTNPPNESLIKTSKERRIFSYGKIETIEEAKNALNLWGPLLITFGVYNYGLSFWNIEPNNTYQGSHCVTIVGYTEDSFILRNSWGTSWGNNGETYLPFSEFSKKEECWAVVDEENMNYYLAKKNPVWIWTLNQIDKIIFWFHAILTGELN